ncbi:hypothetical protein ACWDTP_18080 [Mycobacterium sp. NPDC003449]
MADNDPNFNEGYAQFVHAASTSARCAPVIERIGDGVIFAEAAGMSIWQRIGRRFGIRCPRDPRDPRRRPAVRPPSRISANRARRDRAAQIDDHSAAPP